MTTTLITGANKGLGFETAGRLIAAGHQVWAGARDPERGQTAADTLGARFVALDVTDQSSVDAAAQLIESEGGLDVLINNAGISGGFVSFEAQTPDHVRAIYETNVFGLVRVTQAFVPLLRRSRAPVIVNVSRGMGSLGYAADGERLESTLLTLGYPSSKAAVNMITAKSARALDPIRVNAVDPGYTATDFNQHRGVKPVAQGAEVIVRMARIGPDGPTATFVDENGRVPW